VKLDGIAESVVFFCTLEGVIPDITLSNYTRASHEGMYKFSAIYGLCYVIGVITI
jgi:hypothetical protein